MRFVLLATFLAGSFWQSLLTSAADESQPADRARQRRESAREFHARAQQRTGVLVPLCVYPANIHTNPVFNRLIELKRRFETVPFWVIVNPASGPGSRRDANYTKAIDRLQGAGCVVLGYVSTSYGKRPVNDIEADLRTWQELYPRIHGVFFDEMVYEDTPAAAAFQAGLNRRAKEAGFWPTVANPGTATPGRFFETEAADVIVVHEGAQWPSEEQMHGNYFGGYSDHPPFTRAVLVHSMPQLDLEELGRLRRFVRWIYVTEDKYVVGDPKHANPWDSLSMHLEVLCRQLERDGPGEP